MAAGRSAHDEAQRSAARAQALAHKAQSAASRAVAFEKGADGEQHVARELAPLTADGFYVLHDRRAPVAGGNVDHVLIGPSGVFVLDAKQWAAVRVRDGKLYAGRSSRPEALERARIMAAEVSAALHGSGLDVPVVSGLVFVAADGLDVTMLDDVALIPVERLTAAVRARPAVLTNAQVEQVLRRLSAALPPYDAPAVFPSHEDLVGAGGKPSAALMDKAYWCYYVTEWRAGTRHRLFLKDERGRQLGWRDGTTGERHLADDLGTRARLDAEALLARIGRSGADGDAPKIPNWWYGANPITAPLVTFVVGTRWRNGGKDRLYAWLANAKTPRVELGYVDLKTGYLAPAEIEAIAGQLASTSVILGHLARLSVGPLGLQQ